MFILIYFFVEDWNFIFSVTLKKCYIRWSNRYQFVFRQSLVPPNTLRKLHISKKNLSSYLLVTRLWFFRGFFDIYFRECYIKNSWRSGWNFLKYGLNTDHEMLWKLKYVLFDPWFGLEITYFDKWKMIKLTWNLKKQVWILQDRYPK